MPLVRAGKVLKPHGVNGFVRCAVTGDPAQRIGRSPQYWIYDPRSSELLPLLSPEFQHKPGSDTFLLRANGWQAPEPLHSFQGCDIVYFAQRGELPREEGEVYFFELVGLEVRTPQGAVLGHVTEVVETGASVLLELDTKPIRLIPFTARDIPEVNLSAGYLVTTYGGGGYEDAR
jgi:16S rRNA processing protein RimM